MSDSEGVGREVSSPFGPDSMGIYQKRRGIRHGKLIIKILYNPELIREQDLDDIEAHLEGLRMCLFGEIEKRYVKKVAAT